MFSKSEIKERFPVSFYQRGLTYYQDGRVHVLNYDTEKKSYTAHVHGTDDYEVVIELLSDNWFGSCECAAFDTYGTCKHIAAVLIAISDSHPPDQEEKKEKSTAPPKNYDETDQLIRALSDYDVDLSDIPSSKKDRLQVEFTIKGTSYPSLRRSRGDAPWTIEMKVGVDRLYIVKDIRAFLDAVLAEESLYFTKKFSYEPHEQEFDERDYPFIELLLAVRSNEKVYLSIPDNWGRFTDNRELILPPLTANEFLEELYKQDRSLRFEFNRELFEGVTLYKDKHPFDFAVEQVESDYVLHLNGFEEAAVFGTYGWVFHDESLYKVSQRQQKLLRELAPFRNSAASSVSISGDQIEPFLSQVVPRLKKLGDVTLSEDISEKIESPALRAKVYVNAEGERLLVNVTYKYGEDRIDPFDSASRIENKDGGIILRDSEKEQQIMALIEQASLKFNGRELYVDDEALIFDFLYWTLPRLDELAEVLLTDSAKKWLLDEESVPVTSVDVDRTGTWLDVSFDMKGINEGEISNVLKAMIERKRYYRLENGSFVSIEDEDFQHVGKLLDELNIKESEISRGDLKLPLYRGLQIDETMGKEKRSSRYGKAFRELLSRLKHPEDLQFSLPEGLDAELRSYQLTGFQWLKALGYYHLGGILADDMGLGKTLQSISYLLSEKEENPNAKALVIAPASLIYNWKKEFEKFAPSLDVAVNAGAPPERRELLSQSEPDVWITSYPTLRQDISHYEAMEFDSVILDEAQAIKNPATKTSQAVRQLRARKRFALSGTPIENSLDELWALFHSIMPGFFQDLSSFKKLPHEQISRMVRPFILRRVKQDVLKELPDKIETVQVSELTKQQKELYLGYLHRIQEETKESLRGEGFQRNRMKILAGLTRLRQLCCHPSLFLENYDGYSGKLEQLMDIVATSIQNKQRILIFSQFASMLRIIQDHLTAAGHEVFYLDGQTPSKERVEMTERFNDGEKEIFLISLKAGGTGLNLTGADTVILYDLWWNPAVEEQAAGRAHRIGQKKVVQVLRLITQGTIEEKIYELQQKKKELIQKVIQPGETMISSLSEEEIKEILSI